jgi:hypothetical protein
MLGKQHVDFALELCRNIEKRSKKTKPKSKLWDLNYKKSSAEKTFNKLFDTGETRSRGI